MPSYDFPTQNFNRAKDILAQHPQLGHVSFVKTGYDTVTVRCHDEDVFEMSTMLAREAMLHIMVDDCTPEHFQRILGAFSYGKDKNNPAFDRIANGRLPEASPSRDAPAGKYA